MRQQAEQQGARTDEAGNPTCSHLIVDETNVKSLPFTPHEKLLVVIQEVNQLCFLSEPLSQFTRKSRKFCLDPMGDPSHGIYS